MTDMVTGDTGSKLVVTCNDNDTSSVIDLTGASVVLRWEGDTQVESRAMTITDAANGVAEYKFAAGEIIAPKMRFEVEITAGNGDIITNTALIELVVREQLG